MSGYAVTVSTLTGCQFKKEDPFYIIRNGMPNINIESFCISDDSDKVEVGSGKRYGGIVCYSLGSLADPGEKHRPSQIFIRDSDKIRSTRKDEGQIHGALCREFLGHQPSKISNNSGVVSGFSISDDEVRINSASLNLLNQFSDGKNKMNDVETAVIKYIIDHWINSGKTYYTCNELLKAIE